MRTNAQIEQLLTQAASDQRCAVPADHAQRSALQRRVAAGELVSPYRGVFADRAQWQQLNPAQQTVHTARALHLLHPGWVFAGPTAAAVHGVEHQWTIHHAGLYIADSINGSGRNPTTRLNRISMPKVPRMDVDGLPVTTPARMAVDCGMLLPFPNALAIYDSVLAKHLSERDDIRSISLKLRRDTTPIRRLLHYADEHSDNGGESMMRGIILEERFMPPLIQQVIANPQDPSEWYRVDFMWRLADGRVIVGEYDGTAKYVDPVMTDRRSIQEVVNRQTHREQRLYALGVSAIFRAGYDEVMQRDPLISKLLTVEVPRR